MVQLVKCLHHKQKDSGTTWKLGVVVHICTIAPAEQTGGSLELTHQPFYPVSNF